MSHPSTTSSSKLWVLVLLGSILVSVSQAQGADSIVLNKQDCLQYLALSTANTTASFSIEPTIVLWQAIVLMLAVGFFALLVSLVHMLVRRYVYYDWHLLDTFFDGGGDVNFALIACSIVAKWTWTSSVTWSSNAARSYGLVGHFWYAAGSVVHLFLFAIVAVEIRIKAPGAKTFLQVIRTRHGTVPHIIIMIFAFFCNLLVAGMVMMEGVTILRALTDGLSKEVASIVLAAVVGMLTVVGGVGGFFYIALFSCIFMFAIMLVYFTDVFYDPSTRDGNMFGSPESIYSLLACGRGHDDNERYSLMTFLSQSGLMQGVMLIITSFSPIFVNQSFWLSGVSGKPSHSVWGFLTGGLVWFPITFCAAFTFGMAYWAMSVQRGGHLISDEDALKGLLPVYVSQQLLGITGDFLMFLFTTIAMVTTLASEVLGASSIVIYDIYQAYVAPFSPTPINHDGSLTVRKQRQSQNMEYLEYDRRCTILKRVVVICVCILLIPLSLALLAINVDLPWLFGFLAVMVGSCVLPIALSVSWHRTSGAGVTIGAVVGMAAGVIAWLVYASTFDGSLEKFKVNTGRTEVFLVGAATSLGLGGLLCVIVSLTCGGGCDGKLIEEEEWEKTRELDNPIVPWTVKYAPDVGMQEMSKGKPHFYTIRRAFKWSEISAYIFGVLFAVSIVLVWPACMLMEEVFDLSMFKTWTIVVLAWMCLGLVFVLLVPIISEVVQVCMQNYYNRMWTNTSSKGMSRLEEDPSADGSMNITNGNGLHGNGINVLNGNGMHGNGMQANGMHGNGMRGNGMHGNGMQEPQIDELPSQLPGTTQAAAPSSRPVPAHSDAYSTRTESDFQSGIDQEDREDKERWKTFIHLE